MIAPLLTITAYGLPAPQGSKRHVGRGVMVESSKNVKPWREAVKAAALDMRAPGWIPIDAPLVVSMVFTMPKPASAPKRRRTWPMRTPDLSKLIRSTEDALTDAGIWRDDARVVRYVDTGKAYPGEDDLALTSPGVVIRIWPLAETAPPVVPPSNRLPACGAVNSTLGLTCNRAPHPPEYAHYQADSNSVSSWSEMPTPPVVAPYGTHGHDHTDDVHLPAEVTA